MNSLKSIVFCSFYGALYVLGLLISLLPMSRNTICFLGHQGFYNGNAKALFESCQTHWGEEYAKTNGLEFRFFYRKGEARPTGTAGFHLHNLQQRGSRWTYLKALFSCRVFVITTPGYDWKWRVLFARGAKKILVSNGVPLKAPGMLSPHFTPLKTLKYLCYWKDINELWVSSDLERYIASSSLRVPIRKIFVRGAARQSIFTKDQFAARKAAALAILDKLFGAEIATSKRVLIALTQRAYLTDRTHSAIDSLCALEGFEDGTFASHLKHDNACYFVREHFLTKDADASNAVSSVLSVGPDKVPDLNDIIAGFDVVITDYSGLYLDLLDLDVQIGLLRFPGDDFIQKRGLILPDIFLSHTMEVRSLGDLITLVQQEDIGDLQATARAQMHRLFFNIPASDCEQANRLSLRAAIDGDHAT